MDITLLDSDFNTLYIIDDHISINWSTKYNESGNFELTLPRLGKYNMIDLGMYFTIPDSEYIMIVEKITKMYDPVSGSTIKVEGSTLDILLARRVVREDIIPDGFVEDVIFNMIKNNCINTDSQRILPGLRLKHNTDPRTKTLISGGEYKNKNLLDTIKILCRSANAGFKMVPDYNGGYEFSIYFGEDRSWNQDKIPPVVFSPEYDNLVSSNYIKNLDDYKNFCYVSYTVNVEVVDEYDEEGNPKTTHIEQEIRETTVKLSNASGLKRYEMGYTVSSNPDTNTEASAKGEGLLALQETSMKEAFDGELNNQGQFMYGRDYSLGDLVQVEDDEGKQGVCRVSEIVISEDVSGKYIIPTFVFDNGEEEEW